MVLSYRRLMFGCLLIVGSTPIANALTIPQEYEKDISIMLSEDKVSNYNWERVGHEIALNNEEEKKRKNVEQAVLALVKGHLEALHKNDQIKAYHGFTSDVFQNSTSLANFTEFLIQYPMFTSYQSYDINSDNLGEDKGVLEVALLHNQEISRVKYFLEKQNDHWKIFGFRIIALDETGDEIKASNTDGENQQTLQADLEGVVRAQLSDIQHNDIFKAYFAYTSKQFQAVTSIDLFKDFIKHYPVLTSFKSIKYNDASIIHEHGVVSASLLADKDSAVVKYALIKENHLWKIHSIEVQSIVTSSHSSHHINSDELMNVIKMEMKALHENDLLTAYYGYTSRSFKEKTPYNEFEQFIESEEVLSQNKEFNINSLYFDQDIGTFEGDLTSTEGDSKRLKFSLHRDEDKWRIFSIEILPQQEIAFSSESDSMKKSDTGVDFILIGSEVDNAGKIAKPAMTIRSSSDKIYVNLFISNGIPGEAVELSMEHQDSGSKVNPASANILDSGDSLLSFIFTAPPNREWPKGSYLLIASLPSGQTKTLNFIVE